MGMKLAIGFQLKSNWKAENCFEETGQFLLTVSHYISSQNMLGHRAITMKLCYTNYKAKYKMFHTVTFLLNERDKRSTVLTVFMVLIIPLVVGLVWPYINSLGKDSRSYQVQYLVGPMHGGGAPYSLLCRCRTYKQTANSLLSKDLLLHYCRSDHKYGTRYQEPGPLYLIKWI